ncbi:MAG TPA: hypothetical protein VFE58_00445 [Tepidisphaeraceae bacterium]|jgi:hypothetical protein|nr:hypothetical protein [Tepidisphaeraceae bacterium]
MMKWRWMAVVLAAAVVGGCAPSQRAVQAPQKATSMALDPCADQLQDIAGLLLEYYVGYHKLPGTIEELKALAPGDGKLFVCPTSGEPYVYNPAGLRVAGSAVDIGKIVLYDATPVHHGMRWGIAVKERGGGQPIVTRVIAMPGGGATTRKVEAAPWK